MEEMLLSRCAGCGVGPKQDFPRRLKYVVDDEGGGVVAGMSWFSLEGVFELITWDRG